MGCSSPVITEIWGCPSTLVGPPDPWVPYLWIQPTAYSRNCQLRGLAVPRIDTSVRSLEATWSNVTTV